MAAGPPTQSQFHPPTPSPRRRPRPSTPSLECPICLALLSDPTVTPCGHTFCAACISTHAHRKQVAGHPTPCPVCHATLGNASLYPNRALSLLVESARTTTPADPIFPTPPSDPIPPLIQVAQLTDAQVDLLLKQLLSRKAAAGRDKDAVGTALAVTFLEACRRDKQATVKRLGEELALIEADLQVLRTRRVARLQAMAAERREVAAAAEEAGVDLPDVSARSLLVARYRDNVEAAYFQQRRACGDQALGDILEMLVDATSISSVTRRSSIQHIDILRSNHNLISSIEFNASATLFATAGVTKRIKVFEFNSLIESSEHPSEPAPMQNSQRIQQQHHYPVLEIPTISKLSCLSWSHHRQSVLAASTYNGDILIHDTETNTLLQTLREHTKRTWYVDFSAVKKNWLLSGSDDNTVKLWDVDKQQGSVMTLQTSANVCCVKFNPDESNELAFGSADHNVYTYDLRNPKTPLCVFEGHYRAVSHVLFLNRSELISASTDSSCKLWNVKRHEPGLSYAGHTNDRNFVGLCGSKDFFACGSEDNSVYVYHKGFAGPVVRYGFGSRTGFVSTVAWKPNSNLIVAANSTGGVEILELH